MKKAPRISQLTAHVLTDTSKEEMQSFFQWYLRHDNRAQLLFLTRYSDSIPLAEDDKYEWLFYKSIQLLRGSSAYLGYSKQKTLLKIYNELYMQAADAIVRNHYVKTFYILTNGLTFARLLQRKERSLHTEFTTTVDNYLKLLFNLHECDLPRDLVQSLIEYVDSENGSPHPLLNKSFYSFPRLKIRLEYLQNGFDALYDYVESRWNMAEIKNTDTLGELYYTLYSEPWSLEHIEEFKQLHIPREIWKNALQRLHRHEQYSTIRVIWDAFNLDVAFSDPRYLTFVSRMRQVPSSTGSNSMTS